MDYHRLDSKDTFRSLALEEEISQNPFPSKGAPSKNRAVPQSSHSTQKPPPPKPHHVEPHFVLKFGTLDPVVILTQMLKIFEQIGKIHIIKQEDHKLSCSLYELGQATIPFIVSVFSVPETQSSVVEFQRRRGSVLVFSRFWDEIRTHIDPGAIRPRNYDALQEVDVPVSEEDINTSLNSLIRMAKSDCWDMMDEGFRALAKLARDPKVQNLMIQSRCLDLFLEVLTDDDEDIQRSAVFGLENLCNNRVDVCATFVEKGGRTKLSQLILSDKIPKVLARHYERSLSNIASVSNMLSL